MSVRDEVDLVGLRGWVDGYENSTPANPRLCIPELTMQDGPAGVAGGARGVTMLPAPIALAATWNTTLAGRYGAVIGTEARGKGIDVAQGPVVDIARVPQGGRTWEGMGEDPTLTGDMAAADIRGIQGTGVMATVKHLALNNQETHRMTINDVVSQRTLREIYLPAFRAAITRGHAAAAMCAYNRINGTYSCADKSLLTGILRDEWGFRGFVRSDDGATHGVAASYSAGMDQARPGIPNELLDALSRHQLPRAVLNQAVHRVLRQMFAYGLFNRDVTGSLGNRVTTPTHATVALHVAEAGTVLLKNTGVLPLRRTTLKSIAVIGSDAGHWARTAGIGSGHVRAPYVISPAAGIKARAGAHVAVRIAPKVHGRLLPPEQTLAGIKAAVRTARSAGVAVVFANDVEHEGADRRTLALPYGQNRLISAVAAANPHTVVVLNSGGPVLMPWLSKVAAVVEAWYPGQEDGRAAAAVLFGDVNPSGKLPLSFPVSAQDAPTSTKARWPGIDRNARYTEALAVGYRWYTSNDIKPLFPFGYGLSYTSFKLSGLAVRPHGTNAVTVTLTVANTGRRSGTATPQVYLGYPSGLGEPPRQLRAFDSVQLAAGQQRRISMTLSRGDFQYWNDGGWVTADGGYRIMVGSSSANLPLRTTITAPGAPPVTPR